MIVVRKKRGLQKEWCSLRCRSLFLQQGYEEEYACEKCGNKFIRTVTPKLIKSHRLKRHCSKSCVNYINHRKNYVSKGDYTKICARPYCNTEFKTPNKLRMYCSKRCKFKPKPEIEIICGNPKCNNKVMTNGKRKYCSSKCVATAQYWRERAYDPEYHKRVRTRTFSNKVKYLFLAYKGNKCEKCGTTENLEIHHKRYTTNYQDWNCFCITCHRKHHSSPV